MVPSVIKKPSVAVIGVGFFSIIALAFKPLIDPLPLLIWNASNSLPVGLYAVERRVPKVGEIAVLKPPEWAAMIADQRRYLPRNAWLLKQVAASGGDIACRFGSFALINGKVVARASERDKSGRAMPIWRGCKRLRATEIFVVSRHRNSFDSRYFGSVDTDPVIGTAKPLIILSK